MKHTELPWKVDELNSSVGCITKADDINVEIACTWNEDGNAEANAAFIVKACNNHYQLLEALEKIVRQTEDMIPPFRAMGADQMMKIAKEAIKQASEACTEPKAQAEDL